MKDEIMTDKEIVDFKIQLLMKQNPEMTRKEAIKLAVRWFNGEEKTIIQPEEN